MERELPHGDEFDTVRGLIDDVLRANAAEVGPRHFDENDEIAEAVEAPILGEWVLLTYWTDSEGEHHYVRICSPHLSPHARMGLLDMFTEE